jgi:DNA-binding IclR family transcriptional regulator
MILVLQKVATILDLLKKEKALGLSDISRQLKIHKATLSHIMKTLESIGFVKRDEHGEYVIGPEIHALSQSSLKYGPLAGIAQMCAESLVESIREFVVVSMLYNGRRFNLARIRPERSLFVSDVHQPAPTLFNTATGRVLLAFNKKICEELKKDPEAAAELAALAGILPKVRIEKSSTVLSDDGEALALAVPVFDRSGEAWITVGAGIPLHRYEQDKEFYLSHLRRTAEEMGEILGNRGLSISDL